MIKRIPFDIGENVVLRITDAHGRLTGQTELGVVQELDEAAPDPFVTVRIAGGTVETFTRCLDTSDWIGPNYKRLRANDPRIWMPAQYKDDDGQIPVFQRFTVLLRLSTKVEYLVVDVGMKYAVAEPREGGNKLDPLVVHRSNIENGFGWRIVRTLEEPRESTLPHWCKPTGGAFVFDGTGFREV